MQLQAHTIYSIFILNLGQTMKILFAIAFSILGLSACASKSPLSNQPTKNSAKAMQAPYVLLVSIDGFRWDYIEKYNPKFLNQWVKHSARLESLRPAFPTKTFPNHLTIVTGCYRHRHGILANSFYAPDLKKSYSLRKSEAVLNPDFYLVKPLWVLAQEQGMQAASYFWPGSEAPIAGTTPAMFMTYDHNKSHRERIDTVIDWYQLPAAQRPHLTTMYFHDVDAAGHDFGQDSPQLIAAINKVDNSIKTLVQKLKQLPIDVNIVLISDHGMAQRKPSDFEKLPTWLTEQYYVKGSGPIVHIYDTKSASNTLAQTVEQLNATAQHFQCYRYQDIPPRFNASQSRRIGDIACLADKDWAIGMIGHRPVGDHGWSQFNTTDMDGIFYANGPAFKKNVKLPPLENIHIMPLLAHILGLEIPHEIDGNLQPLAPLLKTSKY